MGPEANQNINRMEIDESLAALKRYLIRSPVIHGYRCSKAAKRDLRRELFRAASVNGKYIDMFFEEATGPEVRNEVKSTREWAMGEASESGKDPSHPGRPCVRKFKKGEPTYRCL